MVPAALARARLPEPILEVLRRLSRSGFRSWLVGGAVRDVLLGRPRTGNDFDVATPATPEQVGALFRRVVPTGIDHGTVTVIAEGGEPVEVTTFRGEGAYEDGRRPSSVRFHGDLEADLARRDFTMNAIAYDPLARELRDPFSGRADLARKLVRAVGDPATRFGEDGLRPLRAVRFAAQLGFALHRGTRAAIPGALPVVGKVSLERVTDEIVKLACAEGPDRGLALLAATGLLGVVLPGLAGLPGRALRHAGRVAAELTPEPALRLAGIVHVLPAPRAAELLAGLRLPRRVSDEALALAALHACRARGGARLPEAGEELRRWLSAAGRSRAPALVALARAEARAAPPARRPGLLAEARRLEAHIAAVGPEVPLETRALALDGGAVLGILGGPPGPHVGEALRHLLDRVLATPEENTADRLEAALRAWWAGRRAEL